jgi:hypothetical protein
MDLSTNTSETELNLQNAKLRFIELDKIARTGGKLTGKQKKEKSNLRRYIHTLYRMIYDNFYVCRGIYTTPQITLDSARKFVGSIQAGYPWGDAPEVQILDKCGALVEKYTIDPSKFTYR